MLTFMFAVSICFPRLYGLISVKTVAVLHIPTLMNISNIFSLHVVAENINITRPQQVIRVPSHYGEYLSRRIFVSLEKINKTVTK